MRAVGRLRSRSFVVDASCILVSDAFLFTVSVTFLSRCDGSWRRCLHSRSALLSDYQLVSQSLTLQHELVVLDLSSVTIELGRGDG